MRKLQADFIFDGHTIRTDHILELDSDNKILGLRQKNAHEIDLEYFPGLIMPGFINTHCHLELSHMKDMVPTGTGLLEFIRNVIQYRNHDQAIIDQAIYDQDIYMWSQGIQAVGDICNKIDTAEVKSKSAIRYYSFIEMFDLLVPAFTENTYNQYLDVYKHYNTENDNNRSAVPHAPYSVTSELFQKVNELNDNEQTVSIHNQETNAENEYFHTGKGGFKQFFQDMKLPDNNFQPTKKDSIYYALDNMNPANKVLLVHNTRTTEQNIKDAISWNSQSYWATCPNANLYIENALPNYKLFLDNKAKVTIGTDSLTSNWQLSVLYEIRTIQRYCSYIPVETLLQWSTINGAEALSFDDELGSFEKGKKPGVIQLQNFDGKSLQNCMVNRII